MIPTRSLLSALALAAALAWAAPAAAQIDPGNKSMVINDGVYAVAALPPDGATKGIIIEGGKRYEITKVGGKWVSATKLPAPGSTKGIIINWFPTEMIKKAHGAPPGDLAAKGVIAIILNGKRYQVQGALPPPGTTTAIIIIGGKQFEIYAAGGGAWKTRDGKLPDPGSTVGMIIYGKPGDAKKLGGPDTKSLDDLPVPPKGVSPPEPDKAQRGTINPPEPEKSTRMLGGPDTKPGMLRDPEKSRRGRVQ